MISNYLIIALRHIAKHKLFSLINIICISIGITFAMLIGLYVMGQVNINRDLRNSTQQYVVRSNWKVKDMGLAATTVGPLPKTLRDQFPLLVANYFRYNPVTNVISAGDKHFKENMMICDTSLVSMYGFDLAAGDPHHAFANGQSAVITEALAKKLFGTAQALHQTITISNIGSTKQDYQVSAVLKNRPFNSVINYFDAEGYHVFLPFEGSHYYATGAGESDWDQIFIVGMIELKKGVTVQDVTKAAHHVLDVNLPASLKGLLHPEFVPLQDYYLKDNNGAAQRMVTILSMVAVFILLMAIINFININIGNSSYRLKEIGLRKVFGGERKQLIAQHLIESVVLTLIAGILSVGGYTALRPWFNDILQATLPNITGIGPYQWLLLLVLLLVIGCLAGIYPAFVLSSRNIIHAVKGKLHASQGGITLRKPLLVFQFSLAILVFINALNISRQVSYFFNRDIGYNRDQLLVLSTFPKQWDSAGVLKMQAIQQEMMNVPGVSAASLSFEVPDRLPPNAIDLLPAGASQPTVVHAIVADEQYAATFGLQIKDGTFFGNYVTSVQAAKEIVLNETAARQLGVRSMNTPFKMADGTTLTVTGIVKDFNYSSFQQQVGPLAFIHIRDNTQYRYMTFKIGTDHIEQTIAQLQATWKKLSPNAPFEYNFMDDRFLSLYQSETQLKKATNLATILNLIIVFMGIFGVTAFTLARRNKEIAVRKVLGAGVPNIIMLFMKDYAWLLLIANIIAWPLAYWANQRWLENYVYRIEPTITPYVQVLGIIMAAISLFITLQCYKTAIANPVKNLRTE